MKIGSYEIESQIGEGAFGRTFKGRHCILKDVHVCVKQEKIGSKPYTDLFREEAAIIARLRHPSLPSFMDYKEMPPPVGQVLVLSWIEGEPLDKAVKTETLSDGTLVAAKPIDDEHICWIVDRILSALSYLHGKWQTVHCDIKPANIILDTPDHNATVVDMGMASLKPDEWSKAKGGTPGYLPPEFGTGLPPIPASDIYSVGKIVCFISGGNPAKGEFPDDMDSRLKEFYETWIRHDPKTRPQSVDQLRYELTKLRKEVFGRSSCQEEFKWRNGRKHSARSKKKTKTARKKKVKKHYPAHTPGSLGIAPAYNRRRY
ncbi:protein kinase [Patescibacteria group bacterium]|nr:protein kinase [Patescibacteria group bacterium]